MMGRGPLALTQSRTQEIHVMFPNGRDNQNMHIATTKEYTIFTVTIHRTQAYPAPKGFFRMLYLYNPARFKDVINRILGCCLRTSTLHSMVLLYVCTVTLVHKHMHRAPLQLRYFPYQSFHCRGATFFFEKHVIVAWRKHDSLH